MWTPSEQAMFPQTEPQHSFLDDDDMCAPGTSSFDKPTGDLSTDFSLFKIAKFALSEDRRERFLFAESLPKTLAGLKHRAGEFAVGLLQALMEDEPEVVAETLDKMKEAVAVWMELKGAYQDVTGMVVPMVWKRLYDANETLSKKAAECYARLLEFLTPEDRGSIALTQLLTIAHEEDKEQAKILAIKVLNDAAPLLGRGLCEQFLASELIALADDGSEAVRRAVAGSMKGVFLSVKPPVAQSKLIPALESLARDGKVSVRRAVIEALPTLAQVAPPALFSSIFSQLLKDKNKTIKLLASARSGAFVAAFAGHAQVPEDVLKAFFEQCAASAQQEEIVITCAQYFPAVAVALGASRWSEASRSYHHLAVHPSKPVRKTIAAGIHEVAKVLGSTLSDQDLVPIYTALTGKNEVEEVKAVALGVFARFIACLGEEKKGRFGDIVSWMAMPRPNWRFREMLAKQLAELAVVFDAETAREELWQAALKLISDDVAAVYIPAAQGIGALITRLLRDTNDFVPEIESLLSSLSTHPNHQRRLLFAHMASTAAQDEVSFRQYFAQQFAELCKDSVAVVRLVCAEVVKRRDWQLHEFCSAFLSDSDKEVRSTAEKSLTGDFLLVTKPVCSTEERQWSEALNFESTDTGTALWMRSDTLLDESGFPLWLSAGN